MELVKIKGVQKNKPAREECKNMLTMADIIEGVNAVLNPGKPKINWFAPAEDAVAAVHIKDGKYDEATSNPSVVYCMTCILLLRMIYFDSQRPEAPQGSTSPLEDTGSPISSAVTMPSYFFITVPSM